MSQMVLTNSIIIGTRHRKDMGDLKVLANSIEKQVPFSPSASPKTSRSSLVNGGWRFISC